MCVCVYIYIYIAIHIHMHTYKHTYIHTYTQAYLALAIVLALPNFAVMMSHTYVHTHTTHIHTGLPSLSHSASASKFCCNDGPTRLCVLFQHLSHLPVCVLPEAVLGSGT